MAAVEKIDMSLDDIIKLNKKKLQSGGGGGRGRGGRGQGGRGRGGRGRGGATRGQGGRGRRNSGVSPLKRTGNKATSTRGGRFSQNSGRGTRGAGRGLRGTGRGIRGTARGGRGNAGGFRGNATAGFGGQGRGSNYKTWAAGTRLNQRGKFAQRGLNNRNSTRGAMSNRGWTNTRGANRINRGRGRGGVRGGARGGANLNQQRDAVVEVIKKARRTLQQLNAQQKRQNVVSQRRNLTSPQITSPTRTRPQRKRQWNQRKIQTYNQQNSNLPGDFTVLVDNNRSPPQTNRAGKSKKISNKIRQAISTTSIPSVEPKIQKAVFSKAKTSLSLNQRFSSSQGRLVGPAIDTDRQVFF